MQKKTFDKIQQPFMIKALMKLGIEGMYFNIIKAIYNKPIINIMLWGKTKVISFKVRNKKRVSTLSTLIQDSLEIPSQRNKTGRRN
jgi:hypothetical protein